MEWRDAGDQAALQDGRPAAPGQDAIGGIDEELRPFDQGRGIVGGIKAPEHIGPAIARAHRGAERAAAIAEALYARNGDARPVGGFGGRGGKHGARARAVVNFAGLAAGHADENDRPLNGGPMLGLVGPALGCLRIGGLGKCHPQNPLAVSDETPRQKRVQDGHDAKRAKKPTAAEAPRPADD